MDRRQFLKGSAAVAAAGLVGPLLPGGRATAERGSLAVTHGVMSGDVTADAAVLWSRASGPGLLQVTYDVDRSRVAAGRARHSRVLTLRADRDFVANLRVGGLEPATRYWYRVEVRDEASRAESSVASFRTAPPPDRSADVGFVWGGDTGQGMANRPPFPAFASMRAEEPAFFVFNGDTVYADTTTPVGGPAGTVAEYWAKYKENREDPLLQHLAASVPIVANWDDHEVANDYRGDHPLLPAGRQAFHDYWPLSVGPERVHRSIRWGAEVEVFVLDGRQYADPLDAPDGPGKSLLGEAQREWLLDEVSASTATWKVLVTSSPLSIIRSDDAHQDDWVSYEWELGTLLDTWTARGVRNLVWLTADVHWGQALFYPRYDMWEFVGCPIGANPRRASRPLSPTFGPEERFLGLNERYYGSVHVDAAAATMTVDLKDQHGSLRHRTVIPAR